jgi:ABC 3 transport family
MPTLHGTLQDSKVEDFRQEAESVLLHKSPQRAIHEAFHEMRRRLQDYSRRQVGAIKNKPKLSEGQVTEIFRDEGHGFLKTSLMATSEALCVPDRFPGPGPGAWTGPPLQLGSIAGLRVDRGVGDQAGGNALNRRAHNNPASIAKNVSRSMRGYLIVSSLLGGAISVVGVWMAGAFGFVPGPSIILLGVSLFLVSLVIGRKKGM